MRSNLIYFLFKKMFEQATNYDPETIFLHEPWNQIKEKFFSRSFAEIIQQLTGINLDRITTEINDTAFQKNLIQSQLKRWLHVYLILDTPEAITLLNQFEPNHDTIILAIINQRQSILELLYQKWPKKFTEQHLMTAAKFEIGR